LVQVDAEKKSTDERLAIRDNRIANLEKDLAKSQTDKPNPVTWALVGAGTTAMIIATLATVILVGNSSK
jgi:late competence protein required for DNA uptake (superfamily II DNA/RNA helicase)